MERVYDYAYQLNEADVKMLLEAQSQENPYPEGVPAVNHIQRYHNMPAVVVQEPLIHHCMAKADGDKFICDMMYNELCHMECKDRDYLCCVTDFLNGPSLPDLVIPNPSPSPVLSFQNDSPV